MRPSPPDVTFSNFDWGLLDRNEDLQNEAMACIRKLFSEHSPAALLEMKALKEAWWDAPDNPADLAWQWFALRHPSDARRLLQDFERAAADARKQFEKDDCGDGG